MKRNFFAAALLRALCLCAPLALAPAAAAQYTSPPAKPGGQQQQPAASDAEIKSAQAVEAAADGAAALKAAEDFVKKHAKSALRPQVARIVANKIAGTADAAQRVAQGEGYLKIFSAADEAGVINPHLVRAYVDAKRYDDAYRVGSVETVGKFEDPVGAMITLAITGVQLARQQNPKYVQQSVQLGQKALEMMEANQRPAGVDEAAWADYKTRWLPQLYQEMGFLSLATGNTADAKTKLDRAAAINSTDPQTYALIGYIADLEYKQLAEQHKAASGAQKAELLTKAHEQMDKVIDHYARAVALAEGDARFDQLRAQLRQDLENYYKYRKGSTEGLQQLLDKYKKPAGSK